MIAKYNRQIILVLVGAAFFIPFLGSTHLFDWDEINFAESSREMMITGNYFQNQINFEPFWEKPPLFFWLQSACMSVFGVNEFAARLPNAICGIFTLLFLFKIGKRLYNERFGMIWALLYLGSLLPHMYFRSGIIDPVFNLFIFASLYYIIRTVNESHPKSATRYSLTGGLMIGLAIITKGPVAILILGLAVAVFWIVNRFRPLTTVKNLLLFLLVSLLTSFLWFGYETIKNGPWFLAEFISYQIELFTGQEGGAAAGHQQPFYYHFVVVLLGCFPISILAFGNLFGSRYLKDQWQMKRWMTILFWVVMILFSLVSTKIVHYSSMAYLPLSFLAAYYLFQVDSGKEKLNKWVAGFTGFLTLIIGLLIVAVPLVMINKESWLTPNVKDPFVQNALQTEVGWHWMQFIPGAIFLLFGSVAVWHLLKHRVFSYSVVNAVCVSGLMLTTAIFILPKVERFSQGPAIEFYKSLQNKDVYIWPVGHKSYAHYFYGRIQPPDKSDGLFTQKQQVLTQLNKSRFSELDNKGRQTYMSSIQGWLLNGSIDKDAYFVVKKHQYNPGPFRNCTIVMDQGGFIGLKRPAE